MIHFQCCVTSYHKLRTLRQYKCVIISLFPWIPDPDLASVGPLPNVSQAKIKLLAGAVVLLEVRSSPELAGCWQDPVHCGLGAETISSAPRVCPPFPVIWSLYIMDICFFKARQKEPQNLDHHVTRCWGRRSMLLSGT